MPKDYKFRKHGRQMAKDIDAMYANVPAAKRSSKGQSKYGYGLSNSPSPTKHTETLRIHSAPSRKPVSLVKLPKPKGDY